MSDDVSPPRSRGALVAINLLGLVLVAGFLGLGIWQVQRRAWKLDLITRVEARVHAEPGPAPGPSDWPRIGAEADAYRHLRLTGVFEHDRATLVQALTALGGGYWVLTPFRSDLGFTVLVNRGFVPADRRDPADWRQPGGTVALTGLLRVSEPGGGFLRANDPAAGRWYSRDVAAIAQARGLAEVAPYFIDADAGPDPAQLPVGGLTVVSFRNEHFVYALTWFALAAMTLGALAYLDREALAGGRRGTAG
ncbi:SURF1 family protein [Methylobacterium sp. C25]|uniref:SURF1 family protein n=1 Tax=Methylobacterium sp. C25 TaxID=2721622 RepID=UPI002D806C0B|nr:SURF1 family protein [Methylobacterium sp. C25]MCE4226550.1 SURF1 family protein [Methylobacterium sp. C25]